MLELINEIFWLLDYKCLYKHTIKVHYHSTVNCELYLSLSLEQHSACFFVVTLFLLVLKRYDFASHACALKVAKNNQRP